MTIEDLANNLSTYGVLEIKKFVSNDKMSINVEFNIISNNVNYVIKDKNDNILFETDSMQKALDFYNNEEV